MGKPFIVQKFGSKENTRLSCSDVLIAVTNNKIDAVNDIIIINNEPHVLSSLDIFNEASKK